MNLMKLSSRRLPRRLVGGAAGRHGRPRGPRRGAHLPHRRPRRPARAAPAPGRAGPRPRTGCARWRRASRGASTWSCSATRWTAACPRPSGCPSAARWSWPTTLGLPLVATNDVHFPKEALFEAHDALICIADGAYMDQQEPRRRLTSQHYFKSHEGDGGALRRPPRGAGEHGRDRPALRLQGAQARADPAALRRQRGRGAAPAGARGARGPPRGDPARRARRRPTRSAWPTSSASSSRWASPATS